MASSPIVWWHHICISLFKIFKDDYSNEEWISKMHEEDGTERLMPAQGYYKD